MCSTAVVSFLLWFMALGFAHSLKIRIDCGATAQYHDAQGNNWVVSTPYLVNGANSYSTKNAINGTLDDPIYQTENWKSEALAFQIPVPDGPYNVVLHFAEIYFDEPNKRVFNITVEGKQVGSSLDVYRAAGGKFKAHTVKTQTEITDGALNILLRQVVENPCISGIEVLSVPPVHASVLEDVSVKSAAMKDFCLGIQQANEKDNGRAIQWPCSGSVNQLFDFLPQADEGYRIVATHSSKCLTVISSDDGPATGDRVVQKTCKTPGVDQIWLVEGTSKRQQIKERDSGLCLLRPGTSLNPGIDLLIGSCCDGFNSLWSVSDTSLLTPDKVPRLVGPFPLAQVPIQSLEFSGLCVVIADGSMDSGAPAVQDQCREEANELFSFQVVSEGIYRVVAAHSSLCLSVENDNGVSQDGAIISQNPCTDEPHQLWRVTGNGGNQRLIPNHGLHDSQVPYCLTNQGGDSTPGNLMIQSPCTYVGARETWSISDVLSIDSEE